MNVSNEIKTAYKNGSVAKIISVSFPDINYTVPQNDVYFEAMTLDEAIFDSDSFEAIGCIASKFTISIRDSGENLKGEKIVVTISLDGINDSTIPLFHGYVDTVDREAQKKMQKIIAYDALYSKGNIDIASWYNSLSFPITLKDFRDSLFSTIGVSQQSTTLPNDSVSIDKEYSPNTMTALSCIKAICQINGCFGIINRTGTFEYRFLDVDATAETVSYYRSMDYKDYVVNPVDRLTIRQSKEDVGVTVGSGNNLYIIQGNMFTYNLSSQTLHTIAVNIYNVLQDIEYIPFNASNNGYPWVEVGDNCILDYSVYDFDNSTSSQSVYKDVSVIAFRRTMKGIQSLLDNYSAEGKELQREFVSDLSMKLDILEQTINNLKHAMSTEITTYRNAKVISIGNGESVDIADLIYEANKGNTVIFHEEADLEVEAVESFADDVYTENDVEAIVRYYVNGNMLSTHTSNGLLREGKHILNLMQFWEAGEVSPSRFQAKLTVTNGAVTIQRFMASAYISVKQSEYADAGIEVTTPPNKLVYRPGQALDFTGIVISKVYYDEFKPSEDVTASCVFTPTAGTIVSASDNYIEVLVTYTETSEVGDTHTYTTTFSLATNYLIGIYVDKEPNTMEYYVGQTLDLTGIKIIANYIDGTEKDVTSECVYTPNSGYVFESEGTFDVNISYTESGITETTSMSMSVQSRPDVIVGISIVNPPDKCDYYVGEYLDTTGLTVESIWGDGHTETLSGYILSLEDGAKLTESDTSLTVSYTYNGTTFTDSCGLSVSEIGNPMLKYVDYYINKTNRTITIRAIRYDEIYEDSLSELIITPTYTNSDGVEFTILLGTS